MKDKTAIGLIAGAVVLVGIVFFFLFRHFNTPGTLNTSNPSAPPDYVRARMGGREGGDRMNGAAAASPPAPYNANNHPGGGGGGSSPGGMTGGGGYGMNHGGR